MLSIIIVIAIVLLSIVLAGIGIYVGTRNSDEKEEPKPVIDVSGQYAVAIAWPLVRGVPRCARMGICIGREPNV